MTRERQRTVRYTVARRGICLSSLNSVRADTHTEAKPQSLGNVCGVFKGYEVREGLLSQGCRTYVFEGSFVKSLQIIELLVSRKPVMSGLGLYARSLNPTAQEASRRARGHMSHP